ncbi:MAG: transposase [Moorea sp. SIO2B7]|nr:transposase [Moorena sp. SIO2B7]
MSKKGNKKTEEIFTQVIPVVACSDLTQVKKIMALCGTPRAITYNQLGSLSGWGADWRSTDKIIRKILLPTDIGLPSKLWEWSVNDTMKAILAQQEAAKTFLIKEIYRKTKNPEERQRLIHLLKNNPTGDNWLHRKFRKQYIKGRTYVRNQIVYQNAGYSCKRINRSSVQLEIAGLVKGKRIKLKLRSRHLIKGQIRVIFKDNEQLFLHCTRKKTIVLPSEKPSKKIGIDKGYTEGFYTSSAIKIAEGLGKLITEKTERIAQTNRNRYRLRNYAQNHQKLAKSKTILKNNLGYQVKSKKLKREKATIKNFIRADLRRTITTPVKLFCEDLTQPIQGKLQAKRINRKLNQWMKGELQASMEKISLETGSNLSVVNPAYTSQVDSLTGTLLGHRQGDRFIRYTGDYIQADLNAAINICIRGQDNKITRWLKASEVETELIARTVRYLVELGVSVTLAVQRGWLLPKFKAKALKQETKYHRQG